MLRLQESFYAPIERRMLDYFYGQFFAPLMETLQFEADIKVKLNAASNVILDAIKAGRIEYKDGAVSGQFNARLSNELQRNGFQFDRRSDIFRGVASPEIKAAAMLARSKREALAGKLQRAIDDAEATIQRTIDTLAFGADLPLFAMDQDIRADLYNIGVLPEINERTARTLRKDYTESQRLNIRNWSPDQIHRLREMVQRIQTTGDNASIRDEIQKEWGVSASKAQFLARQETSLFFSKLGMDRAKQTGIRRYRWSTSHDERVREAHKHLQGQIIDFDKPPVVDLKTGRRAHAGEDYNCRCAKIWLFD